MDALKLLLTRSSLKNLTAPAPQGEELDNILQAAMHVPDHGRLRPYRFVIIEDAGLERLTELLQDAAQEFDLSEDFHKKAVGLPKQAPMIIGVVAKVDNTVDKVPGWEQMLTAGCATYAMQLAANAQGYDNKWISGPFVDGSALRNAFKCEEHDKIVALVLLGTADGKKPREREIDFSSYVDYL